MRRPKIAIFKKIQIHPRGYYRYYSPLMDFEMWQEIRSRGSRKFLKSPVFDLADESDGYPYLQINTEFELCWFLYNTYGPGDYRVQAFLKKRKGGYVFWKGEIDEEGFCMLIKDRSQKGSVKALQKELDEEDDPEFQAMIQEDIREEYEVQAKIKYGFKPFLLASSHRGEKAIWSEGDLAYAKLRDKQEAKAQDDNWGATEDWSKQKQEPEEDWTKKKADDWGDSGW